MLGSSTFSMPFFWFLRETPSVSQGRRQDRMPAESGWEGKSLEVLRRRTSGTVPSVQKLHRAT
jgi:hypothetical protein